MDTKCNYIFPTKYDNLVKKAFNLVKDYLYSSLKEINEYQELGVKQDKQLIDINKYHHLINMLIRVRQDLEKYLKESGESCIPNDVFEKFLVKYEIDCLIEQNVCHKFTNNIVSIFLDTLPECDGDITYEWTVNDSCVEVEGVLFAIGNILQKKINGFTVETFNVDPEATIIDIENLVGLTTEEATKIFNDRYAFPNSSFCCLDPAYQLPLILIEDVTNDTATFSFTGNAPDYLVTVSDLDNENEVVFEEKFIIDNYDINENNTTEVTIDNLKTANNYSIRVFTENCSGVFTNTRDFFTTPFSINVTFCSELFNSLNQQRMSLSIININGNAVDIPIENGGFYSSISEGDNLILEFKDINTNIDDIENPQLNPVYKITSVLINNNEEVNNESIVQFNLNETQGVQDKGTINLNFIQENKNIILCGTLGDSCLYSSLTNINDEDLILSLNFPTI